MWFKYAIALLLAFVISTPAVGQSCRSGVDCTGSTPYCSLTTGYCCAGSSQYACQDSSGNQFCSSSSSCSTGGSGGGGSAVIEFYNTLLDNYFITADANEAAAVSSGAAGVGWERTGYTFKSGGNTSVCRFYGSLYPGPNSHFYTLAGVECDYLKQLQARTPASQKRWNFENQDLYSTPPIASGLNGICPAGTEPVYRAYNQGSSRGVDSNHRITTSQTALREVVARGWSNEGVVMCAPQ